MQNAVILLAVGLGLGTLLTATFGSGNYQTGRSNDRVMAQTNTQTGAIRLCVQEVFPSGDPRRVPGSTIKNYFVECTDWYEKTD